MKIKRWRSHSPFDITELRHSISVSLHLTVNSRDQNRPQLRLGQLLETLPTLTKVM